MRNNANTFQNSKVSKLYESAWLGELRTVKVSISTEGPLEVGKFSVTPYLSGIFRD